MIKFPKAKINLGLNIIEKRSDGFHNIESIFVPIPVNDILEVVENNDNQTNFTSTGINIPNDGKPNLVERAWKIFNESYGIPTVDIHLHKNIPIGAGLGGGSSDAAYCMLILNELFNLNISKKELLALASKLGADCAFFMNGQLSFAEGIGDKFSDIQVDLSGYYCLISYPNLHVSTPVAYQHVKPAIPTKNIKQIVKQPISTWKAELRNDFENSVFQAHSQIKTLKEEMYSNGAVYASMSGSGSTVFGIFKNKPNSDMFPEYKNWVFQF